MFERYLPSPTKNEPLFTNTLPLTDIEPVNWEPLSADWTLNPVFGATDAVTEPDAINVDNNASGVKAVLGILNNPSPEPE